MFIRLVGILSLLMAAYLSCDVCAQTVDFDRDIRPIFSTHCLTCHNADRAEAGLSLDFVEAARLGGDSGKPILGGTRETNEILRRVTSEDPDVRMPFEADALSDVEIDLLSRWVDQGTPWPETTATTSSAETGSFMRLISRWVRPYFEWYASLFIAVLLIERVKAISKKRSESTTPGILSKIGLPLYLTAFLCIALGTTIHQIHLLQASLEAAKTAHFDDGFAPTSITELFGDPPIPARPSHEPRIGGTYYRGNNERKTELYNNGHYRTATLELALLDEQGQALTYGSDANGDLQIRLLIHRAPNATPLLFSDDIMSGLLLTTGYHPAGVTVSGSKATTFMQADTPDSWQASVPIKLDESQSSGLIYLYRGQRDEQGFIKTAGMPQIGIAYQLMLEDGKIAAGSDLWMGAIYFPENVLPPAPPGMVPWNEWLDYRPIPVITGEQTDDPDLLGITVPDGTARDDED